MEIQIGHIEVVDGEPQRFVPSKVFCPTGPGGGVDPTCSPGGNPTGVDSSSSEVQAPAQPPSAPHGHNEDGTPKAPYGYHKDGTVRKNKTGVNDWVERWAGAPDVMDDSKLLSPMIHRARAGHAGTRTHVGAWEKHEEGVPLPEGKAKKLTPEEEDKLQRKGSKNIKSLSDAEQGALISYASPTSEHSETSYKNTNAYLRTGKGSEINKDNAERVTSAIEKASFELPEATYFRKYSVADSVSHAELFKPGMVLSDRGVMSTSTRSDGWWTASGDWTPDVNVRMKITTQKGVKGLPVRGVSANKGEHEVLFAPNQRFIVTKVEVKDDKPYKPPTDSNRVDRVASGQIGADGSRRRKIMELSVTALPMTKKKKK